MAFEGKARRDAPIPNKLWLETADPPVFDVSPHVRLDPQVSASFKRIDQANMVRERKPVDDERNGRGVLRVRVRLVRAEVLLADVRREALDAHDLAEQAREWLKSVDGADSVCGLE